MEDAEESEEGVKMGANGTWKLVKVYECPECGEWVQDMNDACNHVCKSKRASEDQ